MIYYQSELILLQSQLNWLSKVPSRPKLEVVKISAITTDFRSACFRYRGLGNSIIDALQNHPNTPRDNPMLKLTSQWGWGGSK